MTKGKTIKPFYDPKIDGVTQSLLCSFMTCRQIPRWNLAGWSSKSSSMGLIHGTIVHRILELVYTDIQKKKITKCPTADQIKLRMQQTEKEWEAENPKADKKSLEYKELSFLIAEATLPVYFDYWHKDYQELEWVQLEGEFAQPFTLKDGRTTVLRGKRDGVFMNNKKMWLFETKNKAHIVPQILVDVLPLDFQNNFYLYNLRNEMKKTPTGVLYNIIRRLGLEQRKAEKITDFSKRCIEDIKKRPDWYFIRMEIVVDPQEIDDFEPQLHNIIEDFLDWWEGKGNHYCNTSQCETKYGRCPYLSLCSGKNFNFYQKRKVVFRELSDY